MQNWIDMPETAQAFAYETKGNSAVIWRCFSRDTKAVIPAQIDGYPVTEIAPYAFSAHMDGQAFEKEIRMGKMKFHVPEFLFGEGQNDCAGLDDGDKRQDDSAASGEFGAEWNPNTVLNMLPEALCGDALEEIVFPSTVLRVGRYCFYNCSRLRSLEFWSTLADWGSGIFTGSHKIHEMCIHVMPDAPSSFKQVLDEIYEELYVSYIVEHITENDRVSTIGNTTENRMAGKRDTDQAQGSNMASLVFPEFFVEGVENTPARILEERIHGTGMKYRNCFKGKVFDCRQYDTLFPHAIVQEPAVVVGKLAMGRLRYPYELSEQAKAQYQAYVKEHAQEMALWILEERDMEALRWLLSVAERTDALIAYLTDQASRLQFTEAMSFLMEYQRVSRPKAARRRMEL